MKQCPQCSNSIEDNAPWCPYCGQLFANYPAQQQQNSQQGYFQPQYPPQQPQYVQCPRCGAYNYPGVPQCHYCQLPFYQQPPQYQPQQYYQQPAQQPEVKPKKQRNAFSATFMGCFGAFTFLVVLIIAILWLTTSGADDKKSESVSTTMKTPILSEKNSIITEEPVATVDLSMVQKEYILSDGHYTVGIDIPAGKCDVSAVSGSGNLSSSNMFSGGINEMFGIEKGDLNLYSQTFSGLKLPINETLSVSGGLKIKLTYTSITSDFEPRVYDESKAITLSNGNYDIGIDIPAGVYNLFVVNGNGNISTSNLFSGGINEMIGTNNEYYISEFHNLELKEKETLEISNGVTIKFIPQQ